MRGKRALTESNDVLRSDHPRACGANLFDIAVGEVRAGSSPRMRGKLNRAGETSTSLRIIPAHAGQTIWRPSSCVGVADHPRACGANLPVMVFVMRSPGSSPRMRGKLGGPPVDLLQLRIIPAHAGQTALGRIRCSFSTDHPRACGANDSWTRWQRSRTGSSPRMRGKPPPKRPHRHGMRIIPAHAGQTSTCPSKNAVPPDHPRACGANVLVLTAGKSRAGSSPRMRGKLLEGFRLSINARIIPAHAGQTGSVGEPEGREPDHPRACGANDVAIPRTLAKSGSSPRMRGKREAGR